MNENEIDIMRNQELAYLGMLASAIADGKAEPPRLKQNDFHNPDLGAIFKVILQQWNDGIIPDNLTLFRAPALSDISKSTIGELNCSAISTNIRFHEGEILKSSRRLQLGVALKNAQDNFDKGTVDPDVITDKLSGFLETITPKETQKLFRTADEYFQEAENYSPEKEFCISLCKSITFPNGSLSYIGARPGGGKTISLINIAREALKLEGDKERNVLFINLEMTFRDIATYYILSYMYDIGDDTDKHILCEVENTKREYYSLFRKDFTTKHQLFAKLRLQAQEKFREECNSGRFAILDGESFRNTGELTRYADKKITEGTVVLIDYVQRMPIAGANNSQRYLEIKQVSDDIRKLAWRKKAVVIAGAQLKRDKEKIPSLGDFRESGDIEQDAHNALAIEEQFISKVPNPCYAMRVMKARGGIIGADCTMLKSTLKYMHIIGTNEPYHNPLPKPKEKTTGAGTRTGSNTNNNRDTEKHGGWK